MWEVDPILLHKHADGAQSILKLIFAISNSSQSHDAISIKVRANDSHVDMKKIAYDTLLCLCFTALCISLPLNGLSPSLSLVAQELHLSAHQRDLYLGAYIYLATMVISNLNLISLCCILNYIKYF